MFYKTQNASVSLWTPKLDLYSFQNHVCIHHLEKYFNCRTQIASTGSPGHWWDPGHWRDPEWQWRERMSLRWAQHHLTTLILAPAILWRGDLWHQLWIKAGAPRHWVWGPWGKACSDISWSLHARRAFCHWAIYTPCSCQYIWRCRERWQALNLSKSCHLRTKLIQNIHCRLHFLRILTFQVRVPSCCLRKWHFSDPER